MTSGLREAAAILRNQAVQAQDQMPAPWRPVLTDSESMTGVASCPNHVGAAHDACDACTTVETWSEQVAAYMAAVGPHVGLALADLLESLGTRSGESSPVDVHYAGVLARLILDGAQ